MRDARIPQNRIYSRNIRTDYIRRESALPAEREWMSGRVDEVDECTSERSALTSVGEWEKRELSEAK